MGGCCSSSSASSSSASSSSSTSFKHSTAKVVTLKGGVAEYKVPVIASQVLVHQLQAQAEAQAQEEAPSWFLCGSDSLLFDDYIPALDLEDELEADQIYFVLPTSKLQYKLSASDMAALAVKASLALQNASSTVAINVNNGRKKTNPPAPTARNRISPSPAPDSSFDFQFHPQKPVSRPNFGISRSASVRKLQRYTSRRAKLAVRSFRLRLATIYEGIVM